MCGIAGLVGTDLAHCLPRMAARLRHRGPDAEGFYHAEIDALHFAHTRLSILDHAGGAQPMATSDGELALVFNGEIYNHAELRRELVQGGHVFRSDHSDSEVLLHGYREWGTGLCNRLNGMWAFAIHDRVRRRLILSRDRFGQKPLYYHAGAGVFAFASELTALLECPAVPRGLSALALQKYFAYGFIPAPHSLYREIKKLPAGHTLVLDLRDPRPVVTAYWQFVPEPAETAGPADEERLRGELLERLEAAVRRRLVADVPVGVFLSGGIDSSTVTALAARAVPPGRLKTFSIGFDEQSFDETPYSEEVARRFETDHHSFQVSLAEMRRRLDTITAGLDEPLGDSSFLPTYRLCEETRKQVTVALGGDGGDELFAGYDPFRALRWARLYNWLVPGPVHAAVRLAASCLPASTRNMSAGFRIKRMLRGLSHRDALWNPVWLSPLEPAEVAELLGSPCDPEEVYSEAIQAWDACPAPDPVSRTSCFFVNLYLQDDILTKVDRASMLHSLEVRSPFLDIEVVDFARRLPVGAKLRGGTTKYLLKEAATTLLPPHIVHRPKKGFGVPLEDWFRQWDFRLDHLPAGMNAAAVRRYIERHKRGRSNEKFVLWDLLLLDRHMQLHGPGKPASPERAAPKP